MNFFFTISYILMSYVFCRVSADKGCSLEYQESKIKQVLNEPIAETIKHTGSAYHKTPPTLEAISKYTNQKFVFYSVDRFSRNYQNGIDLIERFIAGKNTVQFITEKIIIKSKRGIPWLKFLLYLKTAEEECARNKRRVSDAKEYLESQGYFVGGAVPFGYDKVKQSNGRYKLVVNKQDERILHFIKACRTPNTKLEKLNTLLASCTNDKFVPLIFDDNTDTLKKDLSYSNIADILTDYNVRGAWNKGKVARLVNAVI